MKYGCCVNLLAKSETATGIEYARQLKDLGYDYVELPLNRVAQLDGPAFEALLSQLEKTGLPCLSCNDFMPSSFQIVGDEVTEKAVLLSYLERALERGQRLGAFCTVFGSPWSRSCPAGFLRDRAWEQLVEFLRMAGDLAARYGMVIAVEHNNHDETNMLNHFSDGVRMVREVGHPNVKAMCDYYHLRYEGDPPEVLLEAEDILVHTHIAALEGRRYRIGLDLEPMLPDYAEMLRKIGYSGGISVEGRADAQTQWETEARLTLSNLKQIFG